MRVYERRPSGLAPVQLAALARARPAHAGFAVARVVVGVVLIGLLALPGGPLWGALGTLLLASSFGFVRAAGRHAMERPALVLTGRPKWDGVRRVSWVVEADDPVAAARRIADGLDGELGDSLTASGDGDDRRGTTRRAAFDAAGAEPVLVGWSIAGRPTLTADGAADGVWLRIDPSTEGPPVVTLLTNEGPAEEALKLVTWRA